MMDEEREDEAIIPEEDFREAIAACCEDPYLKRYFRLAPPGAKLFIGLGFYSTHFGDRVESRLYAECQAEIEPSLTVNDLKYLIRFEDDKSTKNYLRKLLVQREAAEMQGRDVVEERPLSSVSAGAIPVPMRRRQGRISTAGLQWVLRKDSIRWFPLVSKAAALVAVLLGAAVFLVNAPRGGRTARPFSPESAEDRMSIVQTGPSVVTNGVVASEPVSVAPAIIEPSPAVEMDELEPEPATSTVQVAEAEAPPAAGPKDEPSSTLQDAAVEPLPLPVRKRRVTRVVFTDGRRIVRHPGGKVEVPRIFSCAGAAIKPFWVYGPNPEVEAEKERKARREWKALVEQAQMGSE